MRGVTQILGSLTVNISPEMAGVARAKAGAVMRPEEQRGSLTIALRLNIGFTY